MAVAAGIEALGNEFQPQETWELAGLTKLVERGYLYLAEKVESELLLGAQILAIEYHDPETPLPPGVRVPRTVDCILERNGRLEIWDWKTHLNLDARYEDEKRKEVGHSWQLLDYAWHAQEWFKRPVRLVGHGSVALGPGKPRAWLTPIRLDDGGERLRQWRLDAERIWGTMAEQAADPAMFPTPLWHNWAACTDRHLHYGKSCPLWDTCHVYFDNEALFGGAFRRKET